ncbi:MarR family winged helix-turn-helix transcriptional regulator [Novosphingobium mangrovi (ex Huang et al. 2023)]|uniref:MarR family transcriptional regulator n=1 Tax=Novosphingobium mangrovi (ex Huang et al. 2023) TaxID=2976432 RepID=A0ABT2I885_9SPHN|nr:MarR family transcriptional regulator [Novosphingobium mangrovi (ex Huang et al. 2023)]MCT2400798.1 MarR family transcriptional regulator [Novosphingobium mangrovi (ex Huang et al. 2023)]
MAIDADSNTTNAKADPFGFRDESPRRQVGLRMTVIARLQRNTFDRKVATLNVTRSQWAMIVIVARHPGSTQRTIAEFLEMSEASAGRLIDRLCADGLLERRDRRDDRRARAVYLTDKAEPLLAKLGAIASESEQRMFNGFSDEELEQLLNFMDRIYENVSRG